VLETRDGEDTVRAEPFDAIALDLNRIWPDPPPGGPDQ